MFFLSDRVVFVFELVLILARHLFNKAIMMFIYGLVLIFAHWYIHQTKRDKSFFIFNEHEGKIFSIFCFQTLQC